MLKFSTAKFLASFCLLITALSAGAQQSAHSLEFNLQQSISAFSANHNSLQGGAQGGEIIFHYNVSQVQGRWASDLGIRSVDAILNYQRMANITRTAEPIKGEFGDSFGVLGGLTFPVLNFNKVTLDFKPAFGLLYAGESWFSNKNPVVGSRMNFALKAGLNLNLAIDQKTAVGANLGILHYSNAGTRVPNNGMNVASVGLSVKRYLNDLPAKKETVQTPTIFSKHSFDLGLSAGRRGVYQSKDGLWHTTLYGGYNYRLKSYLSFGGGLDAVYYHTIYDPSRVLETYQSNASSFKRWRLGAAIGPDLWMGNLALMAKYGYYIYYDSLKPIKTYWTAGAKYKLNDWLAVQSKIYIHNTEADFVGFGLMFTK